MIVYFVMLLSSLILAFLSFRTKGFLKILLQILSAMPFIIVSGLRYGIGTDYLFRYVPDYLIIYEGFDVPNLEGIVKLIMKICCFFTNDYFLFFLFTSILINSLVFYAIYKHSKQPLLSILIYLLNSSFFLSMNLVRQYISSAILLIAILGYLNDRKRIKFIILLIISCCFHTSAIFFAPILFFKKKNFNNLLLIVLSIVFVIFGKSIINFMLDIFSNFSNSNFSKYSIYKSESGNLPFSSLIVETAVYLYYLYVYKRNENNIQEKDKEFLNLFINIQWIVVFFTVVCSVNELFIRISSTLALFQIISLPFFWNINKKTNNLKRCALIFLIIPILMSARIGYSVVLKGSMDVLPYKSIFNRPNNIYSKMNYIEYQNNRRKYDK